MKRYIDDSCDGGVNVVVDSEGDRSSDGGCWRRWMMVELMGRIAVIIDPKC